MVKDNVKEAIGAIWRIEAGTLIAGLARMLRDVSLAEELAQDALVIALEKWPDIGIPDKPGAWLMATAKRRAIDRLRRHKLLDRKHAELGHELELRQQLAAVDEEAARDAKMDDSMGDDLLGLIFTACHPVLSPEARAALTLRLLGGLTTEEIARAFLVPEPTIAQRIVRAKRSLTEAKIAFEVPRGVALAERLPTVLEVIYLIFNEGYAATAGDDWMRPALCEEALRLGRILAGLAPQEPEVHGLVGLMEIQASRLRARIGPSGEPILLLDQNRALWDRLLIGRGLSALMRARQLLGITENDAGLDAAGPYVLQAEIAACHARAVVAGETDWLRIAALYAKLVNVTPSPVIELNRAVALSMAEGPAAGLKIIEGLADEPVLRNYHLLPTVRGDLLAKLGRWQEAAAAFDAAASLTRNRRERDLLLARAAGCRSGNNGLGKSGGA